jgi:PadR family transcriptional regulator, regulatory protein PadR
VPKGDNLGVLEQLILVSTVSLGEDAYGAGIWEKVEEIAERSVSVGAIYITLDRLEEKGYLTSWYSDPTPERGGRTKRYFKITASGATALSNSMRLSANLLESFRHAEGLA